LEAKEEELIEKKQLLHGIVLKDDW
jgi:hypothetical protein